MAQQAEEDPSNLIVNYIPVSVSEDHLRLLFCPYGVIVRCKLVLDRFTGCSLGYGFVKYDSAAAAAAAIAALNGQQLLNKRLKVGVSRPPERDKKRNLYLSGLPASYSQQELLQLVSGFGVVQDVRLLYDAQTLRCRGVGFAKFDSALCALNCIAALSGCTLPGSLMPLVVKYADTTSDKVRKAMQGHAGGGEGGAGGSAFISSAAAAAAAYSAAAAGAISPMLASAMAAQHYSRAAALAALSQQQRAAAAEAGGLTAAGYDPVASFVTNGYYGQHELHSAAVAAAAAGLYPASPSLPSSHPASPLSNTASSPHIVSPSSSPSSSSLSSASSSSLSPLPSLPHAHSHSSFSSAADYTGVCLFVYHLPLEATETTLYALFGSFGVVTSAKVMRDLLTGRSKGFGFVNMLDNAQAQLAIAALNGSALGNKFLKVAYKR